MPSRFATLGFIDHRIGGREYKAQIYPEPSLQALEAREEAELGRLSYVSVCIETILRISRGSSDPLGNFCRTWSVAVCQPRKALKRLLEERRLCSATSIENAAVLYFVLRQCAEPECWQR